jgi:adenine/guanine/hypoxanthine permease
MPSVAQLVVIFLSQIQNGALMTAALDPELTARASGILNPAFIRTCGVMIMLANGFILTALLWGSAAAFLIDRRIGRASAVLVVCGALSLFGFIHSVLPSGGVYLPWRLTTVLPYHWTIGYVGLAVLLLAMSKTSAYRESGALEPSHA